MNKTLDYYRQTKGHDLRMQAGRLTLGQIVCLCDALLCVHTVCFHVIGQDAPHLTRTLEHIRQTTKLSLAKARSILKLWDRWTHQAHDKLPDKTAVQGFLYGLRAMFD